MATFYMYEGPDAPTPTSEKPPLFDGVIDAAAGKPLPGIAGLAQALVCCWSQPRHNTPKPLHYTKIALNTAGIVRRYREVNDPTFTKEYRDPVAEYMKAKDMSIPADVGSLSNMILTYSANVSRTDEVVGEGDGKQIRTFRLTTGLVYAYVMWKVDSSGAETGLGPYVAKNQHQRFLDEIHELVWSVEGHSDLQLSLRGGQNGSYHSTSFSLSNIGQADDYVDDGETWGSVDKLARRFRAFSARGIGRNLLLYGPPGTGKTTMARRVARALGDGHTLRIEAGAIQKAGPSAVLAFVRLLRPRVVLFDDLDRCMDAVIELLHCLELADKSAATIVGTINVIDDVDPALLRPGRFDEVIHMGEPSDTHRAAIIAHYAARFGVTVDADAVGESTSGFSQADLREVLQSAATVGVEHLDAEIERVTRQRGLYAGDACRKYNDRKSGRAPLVAVSK